MMTRRAIPAILSLSTVAAIRALRAVCGSLRVLGILVVLASPAAGASRAEAADPWSNVRDGRVAYCEHFVFQRAKVPEGLGGPALEAAKSWHVAMCVDGKGTAYALDAENCQVYRIREGTVRVLAGDGIRGYRDGPADRARFDFGVGSYQDADVKCDAEGSLYVSEGLPGRLRKIHRDADGLWQVTTVAGGGDRMPGKGERIPALEMKVGCTSRFALAPDGTAYFATHSGVYRVRGGEGSLVLAREEMPPDVTQKSIHDWHVGGSHVTPDGWFYWMPGGGPNLLRVHVETGKAEKFAGVDRVVQGLDGPTLLETGFHTVFVAYSPDADAMFTGGGDESILRRIARGRAVHLQKDGTFLPGGKQNGWRLYSPLCLDGEGRLYVETGVYAWGGFVARVGFTDSPATQDTSAALDADSRGLTLCAAGPADAAAMPQCGNHDWPNFRGPTEQGDLGDAKLPLRWSETENVAWKTPLSGKAWSSPVIGGDRIWLTNAPEDGKRLFVVCIDKATGEVLFDKLLHTVAEPQFCHPFNSYASPSPVLDERRVYVSFGAPYNACLDAETGEVVWERTDFVCNHFRGAGSSPFVHGDLVILHFDGSDHQYVAALDKRTGETVWRTERTMDYGDVDPNTGQPAAEGDYRKAFSTPIVVESGGRTVLVSLGSMALYGYDPRTGEELWRAEARGSYSGSTRPISGRGLVFSPMGYTGEIWAVRPDGRGDVTRSHVVWRYDRPITRRSSLVLAGDRLFTVDVNGVAACLDERTGEELWRVRLGGGYSASPIHADGRVYFFDERGRTTVIEAADEYRVVATNDLDDGFMASPAVSDGALFLRTKKALYRVENGATRAD